MHAPSPLPLRCRSRLLLVASRFPGNRHGILSSCQVRQTDQHGRFGAVVLQFRLQGAPLDAGIYVARRAADRFIHGIVPASSVWEVSLLSDPFNPILSLSKTLPDRWNSPPPR
jgi:hypothetical protein